MFGLIKIGWSRVKWGGMDFISFHHLPSYFFPFDLGGMENLPCSILKYPNNGMKIPPCYTPPISIPLRSFLVVRLGGGVELEAGCYYRSSYMMWERLLGLRQVLGKDVTSSSLVVRLGGILLWIMLYDA